MSHQPLMRFSSFFFTCLFTGVPSAFLTCCCFFGVLVFRDLEDPLDEELLGDDAELPESVEAQDEQCEWRVIFRHPSTYNHTKQQQQQQIAPHHSKHFNPLDAYLHTKNKLPHTLFSETNKNPHLMYYSTITPFQTFQIQSSPTLNPTPRNKRPVIPDGALLRTNGPHLTHSNITQPFNTYRIHTN